MRCQNQAEQHGVDSEEVQSANVSIELLNVTVALRQHRGEEGCNNQALEDAAFANRLARAVLDPSVIAQLWREAKDAAAHALIWYRLHGRVYAADTSASVAQIRREARAM